MLLSGIQFRKFSAIWIPACAGMTARGQKASFCKRLIYLDFDESGHVVSITVEHASLRSDLSEVSFLRINKPHGLDLW
ncbi:MAG: hypothetical protein BWK76_03965 [Desulfobulbaceae bacterium A2]|nr:MAG: hypothetical protein BWK76_03965 [Desulfobulbaceae bacterium A2]